MNFLERIYHSNFFIKLRHWEYWPFWVVQFPFFFYWLWLSIKARSLFFFSASNPGIFSGGMLGESKFEVLELLPDNLKAKSTLVKFPSSIHVVLSAVDAGNFKYPIIFKPDYGERGWMVRKIHNEQDAIQYLSEIKTDFLIQEFLELPLEFGVFYVRHPKEENGKIISITSKEMLAIIGNGEDTLQQMVLKNDRAKLQSGRLKQIFKDDWNKVVATGKTVELNSIGNHCLGTKFLNGNNLITEKLNASFDSLSKNIHGFYFGRYDLRCASLQDLENGNIKIMELNGCGAEPAHVYQPGFSIWEALGVFRQHWKSMYQISIENHKRGIPYLTLSDAVNNYKRIKATLGKV